MNITRQHILQIAASVALVSLLTACEAPPAPSITSASDTNCPDGSYSNQSGGTPSVYVCVPYAPDGWQWNAHWAGEGSDAYYVVDGACNDANICTTY